MTHFSRVEWNFFLETLFQRTDKPALKRRLLSFLSKLEKQNTPKHLKWCLMMWRSTDFGAVIRVRMFQSLVFTSIAFWKRRTVRFSRFIFFFYRTLVQFSRNGPRPQYELNTKDSPLDVATGAWTAEPYGWKLNRLNLDLLSRSSSTDDEYCDESFDFSNLRHGGLFW